jgi:hypothetical protein
MRKGRIDSKPLLPPGSIVPLDAIQDAFMSLLKPSQQVQLVVAP